MWPLHPIKRIQNIQLQCERTNAQVRHLRAFGWGWWCAMWRGRGWRAMRQPERRNVHVPFKSAKICFYIFVFNLGSYFIRLMYFWKNAPKAKVCSIQSPWVQLGLLLCYRFLAQKSIFRRSSETRFLLLFRYHSKKPFYFYSKKPDFYFRMVKLGN